MFESPRGYQFNRKIIFNRNRCLLSLINLDHDLTSVRASLPFRTLEPLDLVFGRMSSRPKPDFHVILDPSSAMKKEAVGVFGIRLHVACASPPFSRQACGPVVLVPKDNMCKIAEIQIVVHAAIAFLYCEMEFIRNQPRQMGRLKANTIEQEKM